MLLLLIVKSVSGPIPARRRAAYEYFFDTVHHPFDRLDSGMDSVSRRQCHDSQSSGSCAYFAGAALLS